MNEHALLRKINNHNCSLVNGDGWLPKTIFIGDFRIDYEPSTGVHTPFHEEHGDVICSDCDRKLFTL